MPVPFCRLRKLVLVTVAAQGFADLDRFELIHATGPSKIPLAFVTHAGSQVAGT